MEMDKQGVSHFSVAVDSKKLLALATFQEKYKLRN